MANKHTKAQCEFIVRKLAAKEPPREIVRNFCAVFPETKCDENDVRRLDPSNFVVLPPELHAAFTKERERIKSDPDAAPYANQFWRFVALSQDIEAYRNNNQPADARSVMRQIAEEQGLTGVGTKGGIAPKSGDAKLTAITRTVVDPVPSEPVQ